MTLPPDEVHVHYCEPDRWTEDEAKARGLSWLNPEERARYARFHFDADREIFLAAHALKRQVLAHYLGEEPASFAFDVGEYGRPELQGSPALRFNLTHTRGLVACVIHDARPCGVDVEWRGRTPELPRLVKRCFVADEANGIDSHPDPLRRFFELWTLKEAYIKARGMGMALPLHGFWFREKPSLEEGFGAREDVELTPEAWQFEMHETTAGHQLAVAVRAGVGEEVRILWNHTIPHG